MFNKHGKYAFVRVLHTRYRKWHGNRINEPMKKCTITQIACTCFSKEPFRLFGTDLGTRVFLLFKFRPSTCKFARIGCPWNGPHHELAGHENSCTHPQKSGLEIMDCLNKIDDAQSAQQLLFKDIFSLLSFEKVTFNGRWLRIYLFSRLIGKKNQYRIL